MSWFKPKAPRPPEDWAGPISFVDWTEDDITAISAAIRKKNGQPEQDGFRRQSRVALNVMRGGFAVEMVARAMHLSSNPGSDPDAPIDPRTGHYMAGMPNWCMWVEYARPAVAAIAGRSAITPAQRNTEAG